MIHPCQTGQVPTGTQAPAPDAHRCRPNGRVHRQLALLALLATGSCGSDLTTNPGALRFGQIGGVRVELDAPLRLGVGTLHQALVWESSGEWTLEESISYRGLHGDQDTRANPGQAGLFAEGYASLITQLNDVPGQKLFIAELSQELDPPCGQTRTRIRFEVRDDVKEEEASWTRCADGSLANLTTLDAGPDAAASRVVLAALLARNRTLGETFVSAYAGSVPFGTLERGDDTPSGLDTPTVILSRNDWQSFWRSHAGEQEPPAVDFAEEMVIVGTVGPREEAGDSVEVRRILQVDLGTLTEVYERVPGDFCSPAARTHAPYHIVVAPRTPPPIRFADVRVELVSCGS